MQRVAEGVYVRSGPQNTNAGCIATAEGAVLVDTLMLPEDNRAWAREVRIKISDQSLFLVLTDQFFDHVLGAPSFACPTIAHELTRKEMRKYSNEETFQLRLETHFDMLDLDLTVQSADLHPGTPELAVSDSLYLHCPDREIRIIHLGGHTPGTLVVHLPQERVLFSGDIVVCEQHPFMGHANSQQWMQALDRIRTMDVDTIVPGHGPLCGVDATTRMTAYLSEARARVREFYLKGATRRETVEKTGILDLLPVPADRLAVESHKVRLGVEHLYAEIRKEESKLHR
jgi:cyclase